MLGRSFNGRVLTIIGDAFLSYRGGRWNERTWVDRGVDDDDDDNAAIYAWVFFMGAALDCFDVRAAYIYGRRYLEVRRRWYLCGFDKIILICGWVFVVV